MKVVLAALPALALLLSMRAPAPVAAAPLNVLADSIRFATAVTSVNRVALTLTNYGFIGNNFTSRSPSLEYPVGTGYEHMVRGGLWVGAQAQDDLGAFVGVTTGALDGSQGSSSQQATEFTPAGLSITPRSRLTDSRYYDPAAISDLDFLGAFSDRPAKPANGANGPHRPLNVLVRASVFSWASDGLQDFLVLRFVIVNLGASVLTNAWAGLYTELASGPKNAYTSWPPSSAGGGALGSWYGKAWLQYDAALRMVREHYCFAQPVPSACNLGLVPAWMGVQLLGTGPDGIGGKQVTLGAWGYEPGSTLRDEDVERYAIMSAGTIQNLTQPDLMPQTGDPIELLAVGPFARIDPGDSVTVDFAIVGGAEVADIQANAARAQLFYDSGFDIATPTQLALVSAKASSNLASLVWYGSDRGTDVDIQRRGEQSDWQTIGPASADGEGYIRYQDRDVAPGMRYGYRVLAGGNAFGEAWVDIPLAAGFSLAGVRPNPSPGGFAVSFSLPDAAPARIEVSDVAGRRIMTRDVGALGAGGHVVDLAAGRRFAAGIYVIRLIRKGETLTTRAAVVR